MEETWEKYEEFRKSPAYARFVREYVNKIKNKKKRVERVHLRFKELTNQEFRAIIDKQISLHGDKWKDSCYKKGLEPYPKRDLSMIFEVARNHGAATQPQQNEFSEECFRYKGILFRFIHGQGTICIIGTEKNPLLTL